MDVKIKFSWLRLLYAFSIISAVSFSIWLLNLAKTFEELVWFMFALLILYFAFMDGSFQEKERVKLLEKIKVDRLLGCGEFEASHPSPLSAKRKFIINIFAYSLLIGCSVLLLSFIIIPILASGNN